MEVESQLNKKLMYYILHTALLFSRGGYPCCWAGGYPCCWGGYSCVGVGIPVAVEDIHSYTCRLNYDCVCVYIITNTVVPLLREHFKKHQKTVSQKGWSHIGGT